MQVICVCNSDYSLGNARYVVSISVGDIFTVIGEQIGYGKNGYTVMCYDFEEFRHTDHLFDKRNFSPLSNIDECELVNTKEEYA